MSDVVRLDLTPEEAVALAGRLEGHGSFCGCRLATVGEKLRKEADHARAARAGCADLGL